MAVQQVYSRSFSDAVNKVIAHVQHLEGHSGSVQISLVVGQQLVDNVYTGIVDAGKVDLKFASPDFLADYEKWCMLRKSDVSALRAVLQPLFACAGAVESCKLMAFVEDPALHGFADVLARTDVVYEGMPVIGQLRDFIKEKITEAAAILYAASASQQVGPCTWQGPRRMRCRA